MDFNEQMTIIKESMWMQGMRKESKVKFISPEKWRSIMVRCLQALKKKAIYDKNMLQDLGVIVQRIKQEKFIQATLNIQPFKPKFLVRSRREEKNRTNVDNIEEEENPLRTKLLADSRIQSKNSIIRFKQSIHEKLNSSDVEVKVERGKKSQMEQMFSMVTEEETLVKQFQAKYHPYRKIIEQFLFLLESKYKLIIESQKVLMIEELQQKLITDIRLIQDFIVKSSQPYLAIFKSDNADEKEVFQLKLRAFIKQYIEKHQKINLSIRKIIRMACRKTAIIQKLALKLPDFANVSDFDIPQTYQIDGCYLHSMTALMQFAEASSSHSSLYKLTEFRRSLGKDVDHFYMGQKNPPSHLQISAQTQIELLKFIVTKLKAFLSEVYSQLRYLEVVYGEQDMSYKYDDSSYMYAQVSMAFEALELDYLESLPHS